MKQMTPKTTPRYEHGGVGEAKVCMIKGCIKTTRERKPYCPEHVDRHVYVHDLLQRIEERKKQDQLVIENGIEAVDFNSITSKEFIHRLKTHGARTLERLKRDLQLDIALIKFTGAAFVKKGIVQTWKNSRGFQVFCLDKRAPQIKKRRGRPSKKKEENK